MQEFNEFKKRENLKQRALVIIILFLSLILLFQLLFILGKVSGKECFSISDYFLLNPIIFIIIMVLISFLLVITFDEYKKYLMKRNKEANFNRNLSFEDLFNNESRKKIISKILEEPGIHNNELLRRCDLIKKAKIGQYVAYFPIFTKNVGDVSIDLTIKKSRTTLNILNVIENNPGINSTNIAKKLNLKRNLVKYHVDKLLRDSLIYSEMNGNKIYFHINYNNNRKLGN
ncbi:MAG: winged helix-turn-helix transcriptional regulator [Promethearchaeota archaeon]